MRPRAAATLENDSYKFSVFCAEQGLIRVFDNKWFAVDVKCAIQKLQFVRFFQLHVMSPKGKLTGSLHV